MSYVQTFKGRFTFADAHCLEVGLDRFVASLDDSIITFDEVAFEGLTVVIDIDWTAPVGMFEDSTNTLRELAAEAKSGSLDAKVSADGWSMDDQVLCGGRSDSSGLPPRHYRWELYFAANTGDAAALRELQSRGVGLAQTLVGYRGWSALHLAARAGSAEAVSVLLDAGLEPDVTPSVNGTTPLSLAANAAVAERLLAAGADIDRLVGNSVALALACEARRWDVAAVLLDAGAAIPEAVQRSIVYACAHAGEVGTLHRLLGREPAVASLLREGQVMYRAITSGSQVLVDLLLEHGATLPAAPIDMATDSGSVALVELVLGRPEKKKAAKKKAAKKKAAKKS